jgi:hypothetical protein
MPQPAASVSSRCFSTESSSEMAAAMPPWAQAEDAPCPIGALVMIVTGRGAQLQRAEEAGQATAQNDDIIDILANIGRYKILGRHGHGNFLDGAGLARKELPGPGPEADA